MKTKLEEQDIATEQSRTSDEKIHEQIFELNGRVVTLKKEVERLQQLDKLRAEQALKLANRIQSLEKNQQANTTDIRMLYSLNEQLQERCAQPEEKCSKTALSNETYLLETHEYFEKPSSVKFQDDIGYRHFQPSRRSTSPLSSTRLRGGITHDETGDQRSACTHNFSVCNIRKEKITAPTFQGGNEEKRIKYLKDLKRYIQPETNSLEESLFIISRSLMGNASIWWDTVEASIHSFDEFEQKFKTKFWSEERTDELVEKIEHGIYSPSGPLSRVNYTIAFISMAQDLDKYTEEELVKKLAKHHEADIRFTVKAQGIKDQQSFMDLLGYKNVEMKRERRARGQPRPNEREQGNFARREPQRLERTKDEERKNDSAPAGAAGENPRFPPRNRPAGDNRNWRDGRNYTQRRSDVHALDLEVKENPGAACGLPTENQ